jgi:hypothetical protein
MKSRQAAKIRELGQSLIDENTFKRQDKSVWNSETTGLDGESASNQGLLERLEAENAQLRGSLVNLMLQIQALRDALGHQPGPKLSQTGAIGLKLHFGHFGQLGLPHETDA